MHLLLVEDDAMIGSTVTRALRSETHVVEWVESGDAAVGVVATTEFDLMVLDLGLPGLDGLSVLRQTRRHAPLLPVLILTARDSAADRVAGLDAGADDYLPKPFDLDELLARVRALLRRSQGRAEPVMRHRGVSLDPACREVRRDGALVSLSAKEYALLQVLLARPGRVLTRDKLEETIYSRDSTIESNTIEVYIHGLRRKLGADFIQTLRGVGYRLAAP